MILLLVLYLVCAGFFAIFFTTQRILKNPCNSEVSRREKILHSLNLIGFFGCLLNTSYILLCETIFIWIGSNGDFMNDVFSPDLFIFILGTFILTGLEVGYLENPRKSIIPKTSRWSLLLILLLLVTGILGVVAGILI